MKKTTTSEDNDEISLCDLLCVLLRYRIIIIAITLTAAAITAAVCIISVKMPAEKSFYPDVYTASANMIINSSNSGSTRNSNERDFESLAGLAGYNNSVGSSSENELALYLIHSNLFLDAVIKQFGFIKKWNITKLKKNTSRTILKNKLTAEYDEKDGIFTISYTDIYPKLCKEVVDYSVTYLKTIYNTLGLNNKKTEEVLKNNINKSYNNLLNQVYSNKNTKAKSSATLPNYVPESTLTQAQLSLNIKAQEQAYINLKSEYEILQVTMESEKPIFQVVEPAEIPEVKSGPDRKHLCIVVTLASFFISVFIAFALNAVNSIKHDKQLSEKFKDSWYRQKKHKIQNNYLNYNNE